MTRTSRTSALPLALTLLAATLVGSGCAITPKPLGSEEIRQAADADSARSKTETPALNGPLTLSEAIARGLKYNLDHRMRLMEQSYSLGQLDVARFDLLPRLTAGADYSSRDRFNVARAVDSVTGQPSLANPYISSDKSHTMTEFGLAWNVLDFGLSYYNAMQQANRVLIATERRRKATHQLIQTIRGTYWRALSAQKLRDEVRETLAEAEDALKKAEILEEERVKSPSEALRYQRALLENLRTLESIEQELSLARVELGGLLNLPAGESYTLVEPAGDLSLDPIKVPAERLEEVAIGNNADLREQHYNVRIAAAETRKSLLKLLPGVSFNYGYRGDTNSYLINNDWREGGVRVSWNLLNLLSAPAVKDLAEQGEQLSEFRRMAVQMAIVTQVHLALYQYEGARLQYLRADRIWGVDSRMYKLANVTAAAEKDGRLYQISSRTAAILSLLRRYQALSTMHAASGRLQTTLGLEPQVGSVNEMSLEALTRVIEQSLGDWQAFTLPAAPAAAPERATQ
ncbi:TolC family protein [Zoogloea sp.]|uniref:TolC family protein n=1 Tax=Zoogloea sp. TaxID=49181 RepID=UPI001415BF51|nr:MAG: TolC family protein [Zoogloea sp.]